jgi:membrane protein YqaA with SNARE-associated domain
MALFEPIYRRTLALSEHRHAPGYLAAVSASESIIFPVPPDVMLIPMSLAQPRKAFGFAALCTVASVLGGLVGYLLGMFAFELVEPWLHRLGYWDAFVQVQALFAIYGFWIVLAAGFTPIPYKVFTIASGVVGMPFLPFVLGSLVGRGGRFFLVAGLIRIGGERMEAQIRRHVEWLGWLGVVLVVAAGLWLWLR